VTARIVDILSMYKMGLSGESLNMGHELPGALYFLVLKNLNLKI
jgi:hypothetical protein